MLRKLAMGAIAGVVLALGTGCVLFPGGGDSDTSGGEPQPTPPTTDRKLIDAPILETDLLMRESFPVQYAVRVVSELPNGCHQFDGVAQSRSGTTITIDVTNTVPDEDNPVCTMIYGTHEETVELGTDFESGTEYTVHVNDKTLVFVAQ